MNIRGIYLSLDIDAANIGNAVNPVLAANTNIITVVVERNRMQRYYQIFLRPVEITQ